MLLADFTAIDGLWVALSVLCVVVALTLGYLLLRLAGTVGRLAGLIKGLEQELLPVIKKVGGTIDRANVQLDKMDQVTDSAVDAADAVDTAVRAVTMAVTRPVQRISGLAAGIAQGFASFRVRRDRREAWDAGREAAARREQEIAAELDARRGQRVTDTVRLTIPRDERYHGVARLVVGGLAARLAFSYEHLEDINVALDSLLANEAYAAGAQLTIELRVRDEGVELRVRPGRRGFPPRLRARRP